MTDVIDISQINETAEANASGEEDTVFSAEADSDTEGAETEANTETKANAEMDETKTDETEIARLRAEIALLKDELSKKTAEAEMIRGQLGEFSELFPDVAPEDIPNEVWENTHATGSLAAAYALYHRRAQLQRDRVRELNKKNAEHSTGKVGTDSAKEYFTPSEVRAMSRDQVHANYAKILDSMKKWN